MKINTYTVIVLVDGQKVGGQRDATYEQVYDLMTGENGLDIPFMRDLRFTGQAMTVDRYRVWPTDKDETTSVTVAYVNQ